MDQIPKFQLNPTVKIPGNVNLWKLHKVQKRQSTPEPTFITFKHSKYAPNLPII